MRKSKLNKIALLIVLISLNACATPAGFSCPPLRSYTPEFNKRLAGEMETAGLATVEAVSDYYVLRRQVEACLKATR